MRRIHWEVHASRSESNVIVRICSLKAGRQRCTRSNELTAWSWRSKLAWAYYFTPIFQIFGNSRFTTNRIRMEIFSAKIWKNPAIRSKIEGLAVLFGWFDASTGWAEQGGCFRSDKTTNSAQEDTRIHRFLFTHYDSFAVDYVWPAWITIVITMESPSKTSPYRPEECLCLETALWCNFMREIFRSKGFWRFSLCFF